MQTKKYSKCFQKVRHKAVSPRTKHVHAAQGNRDPEPQESGWIMATLKTTDVLLGSALCGRAKGDQPGDPACRSPVPLRPLLGCRAGLGQGAASREGLQK